MRRFKSDCCFHRYNSVWQSPFGISLGNASVQIRLSIFMKEFKPFTIEEIESNVAEMNSGTMHEVDQLVMMCDTQRSIIKILQKEIAILNYKWDKSV